MAKVDKDNIWKGKKKEERLEEKREKRIEPNEVLFSVKYINHKYILTVIAGNGKRRGLIKAFFGHEECSNEIAKKLILWKNTV